MNVEEVQFRDILAPKNEHRIFHIMTKSINPRKSYVLDKYYSPQDLKSLVAKSVYLDTIIEAESSKSGIQKEALQKQVQEYLEEIGFDRKLHVIRWMGVIFLKICSMMRIGLFVNEAAILKLKNSMGPNPVLFLPTHRSYADFCLMTYLCYHYEIEFPAVAAGMDFHSMAVMGRRMRETGAFFIRRTLAGAPLYAATMRQYVRALVAHYCAPVEFFLEGTRSRSNKSVMPKFGMLGMSLMPFFAREVVDVTVVPVTITYDRVMEDSLFAFEILGVPKPKESTGAFLKAIKALNDDFGNIYVNPGTPISLKEYLGNQMPCSGETSKPKDLQQLTPEEFEKVKKLAVHVVAQQQRNTVATISNLVALVLMQSIVRNQPLAFDEVLEEVEWTIEVLRNLGASVYERDVKSSVERILAVHKRMMVLDREKRLRLVSGALIQVSDEMKSKMRGHTLSSSTMASAVPVVQLQLYVNPTMHYLAPPATLYLVVRAGFSSQGEVVATYHRIRKLLLYEFVAENEAENTTLDDALEYCTLNDVISTNSEDLLAVGSHGKLQSLLLWALVPALTTLTKCVEVMKEHGELSSAQALRSIQRSVEAARAHPYALSLEAIGNCLLGLVAGGALTKTNLDGTVTYTVVPNVLRDCEQLLSSIMPECKVDFGGQNSVMIDHATVSARL